MFTLWARERRGERTIAAPTVRHLEVSAATPFGVNADDFGGARDGLGTAPQLDIIAAVVQAEDFHADIVGMTQEEGAEAGLLFGKAGEEGFEGEAGAVEIGER